MRVCAHCGLVVEGKPMVCSGCSCIVYCSPPCATAAWYDLPGRPGHVGVCGIMRKAWRLELKGKPLPLGDALSMADRVIKCSGYFFLTDADGRVVDAKTEETGEEPWVPRLAAIMGLDDPQVVLKPWKAWPRHALAVTAILRPIIEACPGKDAALLPGIKLMAWESCDSLACCLRALLVRPGWRLCLGSKGLVAGEVEFWEYGNGQYTHEAEDMTSPDVMAVLIAGDV